MTVPTPEAILAEQGREPQWWCTEALMKPQRKAVVDYDPLWPKRLSSIDKWFGSADTPSAAD